MHSESVRRVAARFLAANGYFNVGDLVLYGRWKNHRGKIIALSVDHWGNPTVEIEPVPKGRKDNKVFGLYKIWRADVKEKALAEQAKQASDYDPTDGIFHLDPENPCLTGDGRDCRHEVNDNHRYDKRPEEGSPEDALFQQQLEPDEDEELEDDDVDDDDLVQRVAKRYLAASLQWKKFPGGAAKIGIIGGPYAKTEDGRFMVYVRRSMQGNPGDRSYVYHFSAVDYSIPNKGNRWTDIPIHQGGGFMSDSNQNVKKVFEAVEKWAHEHPLPPPEPKAG